MHRSTGQAKHVKTASKNEIDRWRTRKHILFYLCHDLMKLTWSVTSKQRVKISRSWTWLQWRRGRTWPHGRVIRARFPIRASQKCNILMPCLFRLFVSWGYDHLMQPGLLNACVCLTYLFGCFFLIHPVFYAQNLPIFW